MLFLIFSMCSLVGYLLSRPIVRALGLAERYSPKPGNANARITRRDTP